MAKITVELNTALDPDDAKVLRAIVDSMCPNLTLSVAAARGEVEPEAPPVGEPKRRGRPPKADAAPDTLVEPSPASGESGPAATGDVTLEDIHAVMRELMSRTPPVPALTLQAAVKGANEATAGSPKGSDPKYYPAIFEALKVL